MNKKIAWIMAFIIGLFMFAQAASAMLYGNMYDNNYGYGYQYSAPARVGGFFGANSAFITNLKPGYYAGPMMDYRTRYNIASQYYPRVGGFFGYSPYTYYYGLRSGTFTYQ